MANAQALPSHLEMTLDITMHTIPHAEQRYETCGDWQFDKAGLRVLVSSTGNWRYNALIGIHEAIEAILCKSDGVTGAEVDAFDIAYEKARKPGDESEPGDDTRAPYYHQHQIATGIERILAAELGVYWNTYEAACLALSTGDVK